MSLDEKFKVVAEEAKLFKKSPPQPDLLEVYALYKQSTVGDVNTPKPGDAAAEAKWSAWGGKKGLSKDAAKQQYIDKVQSLAPTYK